MSEEKNAPGKGTDLTPYPLSYEERGRVAGVCAEGQGQVGLTPAFGHPSPTGRGATCEPAGEGASGATDDGTSLPCGWVATTLDAVIKPTRVGVRPTDFPALPYVGMEHVEAETMRLLGTQPAIELRSNAVRFWPGSVLYGRLRPYLNKVLRTDFEGLCSAEFIVFCESPNLVSGYLQYFLNSWRFKNFASHLNTGDRPRVDWDQLKGYAFPLPPLAEQRRIVEAIEEQFTRLDAGVAALRRAQVALKRYRAAVLKAAVEGKLTEEWRAAHPDAEPAADLLQRILRERRARWEADLRAKGKDPAKAKYAEPKGPETARLPALPEGWCWTSFGRCFDVRVGATPSRAKPEYWGGDLPWVSSGEVAFCRIRETREHITELGLKNSSTQINPRGSVLLGMIGEGKTRGQAAILDIDACNNQNCAAIWVSLTPVASAFVYYWLWSQYEVTRRGGSGNNQPALNKSKVEEMRFPLPPLAEQEQIVAEVEARLSVVAELEATLAANLQRAERLRQSILERSFSGRLVPQDANDEPASALLERVRPHPLPPLLRGEGPRGKGTRGKGRRGRGARETSEDEATVSATAALQGPLWE